MLHRFLFRALTTSIALSLLLLCSALPSQTPLHAQGNGSPYGGTPVNLPGTIQAENYNTGGQNVAYNDLEAANQGGQYRTSEGVDIEATTDTGGGFNVGWTRSGEWIKYTVNVTIAGTYTINFRVANGTSTGSFYLEVDSVNVTGTMTTPNTGGWQNWQTVSRTGINLTAGQHVLRLVITGNDSNFNWISFTGGGTVPTNTPVPATATRTPTRTNTPTSGNGSPYNGTPAAIPGTIQTENYNTGGQNVAYNELEAANQGGQYRTSEGVDIEGTTDTGGGFNVGWTRTGEWLKYTVNVTTAGTYTIDFRVASGVTGAAFALEVDGVNLTGTMNIPNTGGWQTWQTISRTGINFTAGQHVLRLVIIGNDGNFNWLRFNSGTVPTNTSAPTSTRTPTRTPTSVPGTLSPRIHLFYYPWYGNPTTSGSWVHWPQGNSIPPNDISSNFYPTLGAYDSGDVATVTQHMRWIQQTGAGVISLSWWGRGSFEDSKARLVMDIANQFGIKVNWHIEPYGGRTAASVVSDINYIHSTYGSHPAFYRDSLNGNRAVFYIFFSLQIADWTPLEQVKSNSIVFAQTTDLSRVAHFGGIYTYGTFDTASSWKWISDYCKANGMLWSPSVAPGYIDNRAVPGNTVPDIDRNNGAFYDSQWTTALDPAKAGSPDYITVTSFNEWHEGSQIEPARNNPPSGFGYLTYMNAYGRTDTSAELAYIDRTKHWINIFNQR